MPATTAGDRAEPTRTRRSEATRRLRDDRRADDPVPGAQDRRRSSTRSSSASGSGTSASGPEDFEGLGNYESAAIRSDLPPGDPELALLRGHLGAADDGHRPLRWRSSSTRRSAGQTFFRAAYYFPAIASSAAITILWIFIVSPDGLFNTVRGAMGLNPLFEALRLWAEPELDRRPGHGAQLGHHPQRLDDIRHVHALLPGLAAVDQRPGLRGGGDRWRERLADVPADHLPAAAAGPLLRRDGRRHRRAAVVRPGGHRRRAGTATRTTRS